jgi:hypothetical protein
MKITEGRVKLKLLKMKKSMFTAVVVGLGLTASVMAQVPNYVPANGLVGYWPFNGNANDESGNGNNGTVNGATLTADRFGSFGNAYSFNGISNKIDIQHSASLEIFGSQSASTISVWFYGYINQISELIGKGYHSNIANYGNKYLAITNDGLSYQYTLYDFSTLNSVRCPDGFFNSSQWYHLVFVRDATLRVYVNGTDLSIATNNAGWTTNYNLVLNNTIMSFGCRNNRDNNNVPFQNFFFNGKIDDIGIWNRALTECEITDLYNAQLSSFSNSSVSINPTLSNVGSNATLSVLTPIQNIQWQSNPSNIGWVNLTDNSNYNGVNNDTLVVSNLQLSNQNQPFRVLACGDTSNMATIQIADTCITNVTVYDTLYTTVTDTLIINTTLGLPAPNNENTILIYPNPASDHITIDNGNFAAMTGYSIKIENNAGQQVFQSAINQQQFYVDLSTWTGNGLYFVHLIDAQNNTVTVRKIVLQ